MLFKIMDFRAYARAKEEYENRQKDPDFHKRPKNSIIDKVSEITFEIARERIQEQLQRMKEHLGRSE